MNSHYLRKITVGSLLLGGISDICHAQEDVNRKWELGFGVGAVSVPDYRGSDEYRNFISAIP